MHTNDQPDQQNVKLLANIKLAYDAMVYAQEYIHHSSTFMQFYKLPGDTFELEARINSMMANRLSQQKLLNMLFRIPSILNDNNLSLIKQKLNTVKENSKHTDEKLGNCDHYASLSYYYCRKYGNKQRTEILNYDNGVHFVTLIDRDIGSKINDPRTWGVNAVLEDAWDNKVYPATLENITMYFFNNSTTEQYDLSKHEFTSLIDSNEEELNNKEAYFFQAVDLFSVIKIFLQDERNGIDEDTNILLMKKVNNLIAELSAKFKKFDPNESTISYNRRITKIIKSFLNEVIDKTKNEGFLNILIEHWMKNILFKEIENNNLPSYVTLFSLLNNLEQNEAKILLNYIVNKTKIELSSFTTIHLLHNYAARGYDDCIEIILKSQSNETLIKICDSKFITMLCAANKADLLRLIPVNAFQANIEPAYASRQLAQAIWLDNDNIALTLLTFGTNPLSGNKADIDSAFLYAVKNNKLNIVTPMLETISKISNKKLVASYLEKAIVIAQENTNLYMLNLLTQSAQKITGTATELNYSQQTTGLFNKKRSISEISDNSEIKKPKPGTT